MEEKGKKYFIYDMRIGIILYPYNEDKPGGLARTIFEWTKHMIEIAPEHEFIVFLKKEPKEQLRFSGTNWRYEVLRGGWYWMDGLRSASQTNVTIFQTPVLPLFYRVKNSVVIIQDFPYKYLKPNSVKEWFRNVFIGWYHGRSLRRADKIVAVSQSTKNDIVKFFNITERSISVVHMGFKSICDVKEVFVSLPEKFFLFVGVIKKRKNVLNVVKAFRLFLDKNPQCGYSLVMAGKSEGEYYKEVRRYIKDEGMEKNVIFLGYCNDGQLSFIYRRAVALLFPSIVEGFGFPVLEAMDCGIPVITSNFGGPSETGRDGAALLVDPFRPQEIADAMGRVTQDSDLRARVIAKGRERARAMTWVRAARELLTVIENV